MGNDTFQQPKKTENQLTAEIDSFFPQLVRWRRDFHRHPESGWTEYRTTAVIAGQLEAWGWKVHVGDEAVDPQARMGVPSEDELKRCEERALREGVNSHILERMKGGLTGVVAEWSTGVPGPVTVFRFDIDCNDVDETGDSGHVPVQKNFRSIHGGCMHACGHDGHASIGLGLAKLIMKFQSRLKGKIRLLFQPAEEGSRGALAMVEKGWLHDVDYFLGGHIGFRAFQLGEVVLNTTGFYATTKWDAVFRGRAAHAGGEPELGRNALLAASTAALNVHAIPRHSGGTSRINVGKLVAGSGRNIVPSEALLQLETRGETEGINRYISQEAERILRAAAQMYDVEIKLQKVGEAGKAEGDKKWAKRLRSAFAKVHSVHDLRDSLALGASEDVVHMMKKVQENGGVAAYLLFGSSLAAMHHQPRFNFDEQVLKIALEGYMQIILDVNGR